MKRIFLATVALILCQSVLMNAHAMGNGNQYLDAQTGLTYTVYAPTETLGFNQSSFKLLACATPGDEWIALTLASGKKKIEIYETGFDQHCSDAGIAKQLANVKIGTSAAKAFVYCDPSDQKKFNSCTSSDIKNVGGYLLITAPASPHLKRTSIQVQGTGGVTFDELVKVAKSLISSADIKPESQKVSFVWDCGQKESKPTSLTIYCADAGIGLAKLKWSTWGGSSAKGTGLYYANDCEPNCASGKVHQTNVQVQLINPVRSGSAWVYTKVQLHTVRGKLPLLKKSSETWELIANQM